jgi:hypothetical protein
MMQALIITPHLLLDVCCHHQLNLLHAIATDAVMSVATGLKQLCASTNSLQVHLHHGRCEQSSRPSAQMQAASDECKHSSITPHLLLAVCCHHQLNLRLSLPLLLLLLLAHSQLAAAATVVVAA